MRGTKLKGLRLARTSMGYSTRQLGELMYVSRSSIGRWERCSWSPSPFEIAKLSDILFTSTTFLLKGYAYDGS
jgi:transcriptional regulator with XRE-family HTH domain